MFDPLSPQLHVLHLLLAVAVAVAPGATSRRGAAPLASRRDQAALLQELGISPHEVHTQLLPHRLGKDMERCGKLQEVGDFGDAEFLLEVWRILMIFWTLGLFCMGFFMDFDGF